MEEEKRRAEKNVWLNKINKMKAILVEEREPKLPLFPLYLQLCHQQTKLLSLKRCTREGCEKNIA